MHFLRSLVFSISMIFGAVMVAIGGYSLFYLSFFHRYNAVRYYAHWSLWILRVVCGISYQVHGKENIPTEASIIFSKHQSTWETFALQQIFPPQVFVIKKELLWVPFFGWTLALLKPISINRSAGRNAVKQVIAQGVQRLACNIWVVIFPEGTRIPFGTKGRYKKGGVLLAKQANCALVPVAHNAGKYWPRKGFLKHPGIIQVVIGKPILVNNRTTDDVLAEAEQWIETTMKTLK